MGFSFDYGKWQEKVKAKTGEAPELKCPICGNKTLEMVPQLVQTLLGDPRQAQQQLAQTGTLPLLLELRWVCPVCGYILGFVADEVLVDDGKQAPQKPQVQLAGEGDLKDIERKIEAASRRRGR